MKTNLKSNKCWRMKLKEKKTKKKEKKENEKKRPPPSLSV
jgi:hypothetical protein